MTNEERSTEPIPPFSRRSSRRFDKVKIATTATRGLGVFATAPIKARHAIGRVVGKIKDSVYRSSYCIAYGDDKILEPNHPYKYLNHSCDPNCELIEWTLVDQSKYTELEPSEPLLELWLHALRDIERGDELTIDYGWDWQSAIRCLCGSPNCRGWICRVDQLELCKRFNVATVVAQETTDNNTASEKNAPSEQQKSLAGNFS